MLPDDGHPPLGYIGLFSELQITERVSATIRPGVLWRYGMADLIATSLRDGWSTSIKAQHGSRRVGLLSMLAYTSPPRENEPSSSPELVAERRRRGEMSCAECRRMKMRCDKRVPCKPCVRRGCGHLCPDGTNVTADGPKLVLAATGHLHDEISILRDRIRDLEGALTSIHRRRTGQTHPLLAPLPDDEDWDDNDLPVPDHDTASDSESQKILGDYGTLAAGQDGSARLFGSVGNALAHVMSVMDPKRPLIGAPSSKYDLELTRCIRQWPFASFPPLDIPRIIHLLRMELPDRVTRDTLIEIALAEAGVTLMAFTPEYVEDTIIPTALHGEGLCVLHTFASLYALLAIGALLAVPGPGETPEVSHYAELSGSAIAASAPATVSTVELIEGMYVRTVLEFMRQGQLEEVARSTIAMACKMSYDIGLHVNTLNWRVFTDKEAHHRRAVFWMLFKSDAWESLCVGRPPVIALHTVDVELPNTSPRRLDSLENLIRATVRSASINAEIVLATQSLEPPSYAQILRLDEKVMAIHPKQNQVQTAAAPPPSIYRIFLHRAFFARALTDHPDDLLKSEYAVSVLATIRGAHETLSWLTDLLKTRPGPTSRLYHVWSMGYAAATVYLTLFERAPRSPQAEDAQYQVEHAISLFNIGARFGSGRAKHSFAVLSAHLKKISRAANSRSLDFGRRASSRGRSNPQQISTSDNHLLPPSMADDPPLPALPSSMPAIDGDRTLMPTTSPPSISDHVEPSSGQQSPPSSNDHSFYPSYLKHPTGEQRIRAPEGTKPAEEPGLRQSVPIFRKTVGSLDRVFPYYRSASNAALWDGAGWDSVQHATHSLGGTTSGLTPPSASLAGEWNAITLGGRGGRTHLGAL